MTASKIHMRPFLSFTQKFHLHTFRDSHFCLCPSGTHGVFFQAVRFCTKPIIPFILQMVMTAIIIISGTSLSCFCVWQSQRWRFTRGPKRCIFGPLCWWISPPCAKPVFIPHLFWHFCPSEGLWMVPLDAKPPLFPGTGPISAAPCTKTQTTQSVQQTTPAPHFFYMFPEQLMLLIRHELGN